MRTRTGSLQRWRDADAVGRVGSRLGRFWVTAVLFAWLLLLLGTRTDSALTSEWALMGVTSVAALACWARALPDAPSRRGGRPPGVTGWGSPPGAAWSSRASGSTGCGRCSSWPSRPCRPGSWSMQSAVGSRHLRLRDTAGRGVHRGAGARAAGCLVAATGGAERARAVAHRLRTRLEEQVILRGHRVAIGSSVGLASTAGLAGVPVDEGPLELLRQADVALYRAKKTAGGIEQWTSAWDETARELLDLVSDLRVALRAGDQLIIHLQPKCDPHSGEVRALEALVRCQHPTLGLLLPGRFLDAATSAGLLSPLTDVVLDLSLRAIDALRGGGHPLPVAINVGAPDLLDPRFASRVAQALDRHGLPAALLRLEVTETVVMQDPARVVRTLRPLRGIGVGICLDDYGTGLSSLAYLRELPIDELKIDRTFVAVRRGRRRRRHGRP